MIQTAKNRGCRNIQLQLGSLRSFASDAAHIYPEMDEEKLFEDLVRNYFRGLSQEVINIFDPVKAGHLLDPFTR